MMVTTLSGVRWRQIGDAAFALGMQPVGAHHGTDPFVDLPLTYQLLLLVDYLTPGLSK